MATKQPKKTANASIAAKIAASLNKRSEDKVAYILGSEEGPTVIKQWVSTGCKQLDYAISNRPDGGLPVRRIVEISGDPSIGKSHIGAQIIASAQRMGGIGCYIDTEQAISEETFRQLGVDVDELIYSAENIAEDILAMIKEVVTSARAALPDRTKPIVVVWDSIAQTAAKTEDAGDFDKNHMGVMARVLSLGMKKIMRTISSNDALLVCINQIKTDLNAGMYADSRTTPGGKAIPYISSVRVFLSGGSQIKDEKTKRVIGINVKAFTRKNKVAPPFRDGRFQIHFGVGIKESEEMLSALRTNGGFSAVMPNGHKVEIEDGKTWKKLLVFDKNGEIVVDKSFTKVQYDELARSSEYGQYFSALEAKALVWNNEKASEHVAEHAHLLGDEERPEEFDLEEADEDTASEGSDD